MTWSKYCSRYLDDAPGIRGGCERHLRKGLPCTECPNRNIHAEVKDLRAIVSNDAVPRELVVDAINDCDCQYDSIRAVRKWLKANKAD